MRWCFPDLERISAEAFVLQLPGREVWLTIQLEQYSWQQCLSVAFLSSSPAQASHFLDGPAGTTTCRHLGLPPGFPVSLALRFPVLLVMPPLCLRKYRETPNCPDLQSKMSRSGQCIETFRPKSPLCCLYTRHLVWLCTSNFAQGRG